MPPHSSNSTGQINGKPDESPRGKYIRRVRDDVGHWSYSFNPYGHVLSASACLVLQSLVSLDGRRKRRRSADGSFMCKRAFLQQEIGMSPDSQIRFLKELEEKGVIEVKSKGMPAKRYVRVDYDALHKLLDEALAAREAMRAKIRGDAAETGKQGNEKPRRQGTGKPRRHATEEPQRLTPENLGGIIIREEITIKEREGGPARSARSPSPPPSSNGESNGHYSRPKGTKSHRPTQKKADPKDDKFLRAAKELCRALRANKQPVRSFNGPVWADYLRKLAALPGSEDWEAVLKWFCERCSTEWTQRLRLPDIVSAREFNRCYRWILNVFRKTGAKVNEATKEVDDNRLPPTSEW